MRTSFHASAAVLAAATLAIFGPGHLRAQNPEMLPDTVTFPSADGKTMLIGYVYVPRDKRAERTPAVVMMHGRAGPYSINVKNGGPYNARTLSKRHKQWGEKWSARGYIAVLVDGFSPRGFPGGFGRGTIGERPETVNEVTVRPLDAYGALGYLRTRREVAPDRIGLQGWSNGGSAALAAMTVDAPGIADHTPAAGFRAALVFYAGCGLRDRYKAQGYRPYTEVLAFHGTDDEETGYETCRRLIERSRGLGGDITLISYPQATHDFDDPGQPRQRIPANQAARADAIQRSEIFFERILATGLPPR